MKRYHDSIEQAYKAKALHMRRQFEEDILGRPISSCYLTRSMAASTVDRELRNETQYHEWVNQMEEIEKAARASRIDVTPGLPL